MSNGIVERIFRVYQKLCKDGDLINPSAYYQRHEMYQDTLEEVTTYIDLPSIELSSDVVNALSPSKRKGFFERPATSPVKSPNKRLFSPKKDISTPPEPFVDPLVKLPIKVCYPTDKFCTNSPSKKYDPPPRPSSPKPNLAPKITLPQTKTTLEKVSAPIIKSPKKTPPSSGEKKDKNIIKVIKNINQAKLIPKKVGNQSGYSSFELKDIVISLGLHPKSNKAQMIDQIKDIIVQYT